MNGGRVDIDIARHGVVIVLNRLALQRNSVVMISAHIRQLDLAVLVHYLIARRIDDLFDLVAILGRDRDGGITAVLYDGVATNRALSAGDGGSHAMKHRRKRIHDWFAIRSLLRRAVLVRGLLGEVHLNLMILYDALLIHVATIESVGLNRFGRQRHEQRTQ